MRRLLLALSAVLSATLWAYACGDGATEPTPTPSDPPRPTTVTVSPATAELTALGATVQLSAEVRDQNGQVIAGATVTWASSAAAVTTVSASGLVTAVANGSATITATSGSLSGSAMVSVAQAVSAVAVAPDTATVLVGDTLRLAATATDANGQVVAGVAFAWASGDTSVAEVDSTGLVSAVGGGAATITATAGEASGDALVTVTQSVDSVTVQPPADTIAPGDTLRLIARAHDETGRVLAGAEFRWSSSNAGVATVDASGLVRGVTDGTATITATAGDVSGVSEITVTNPHRAALVALYNATDGPNWENHDNWLTDALLGEWYGVRTNAAGHVVRIGLSRNNLSGVLPPELGDLSSLEEVDLRVNALGGVLPRELGNLANLGSLFLAGNALSGAIPPELGNLANLGSLSLAGNALSGAIPPELGNLANLEWLNLDSNTLSGAIPPELGNLANLEWLHLNSNTLSGAIPPELGDLANLKGLYLNWNDLSGPIPPEVGNLGNLRRMHLANNSLSGAIPPTFGGLARLTELELSHNPELAGAMPAGLRNLALESLVASGTELCVPREPVFEEWLATIPKRRIATCGEPPAAYLVQAVQSRAHPVPLVADEDALLRVFVTAAIETTEGLPEVRARFYLNGTERHVADIRGSSKPIPTEIDEGDLAASANAEIPGRIVRPGLEMVVEIDPDGVLDASLGVPKRIPQEGRLAVKVKAMPVFDLTLIPFIWTQTQDSSIVDLVEAMGADPGHHELLGETRTLLPIGALEVTAHEAVLSSSNNAYTLLSQTDAIRVMEGGTGHYKGMMSQPVTGAGGVAYIARRSSFSQPYEYVIAHELGHNLNLRHAPCGGASGPDPSYPSLDGSIGAWGYDFGYSGSLVRPQRQDLMSYCSRGNQWISDYHFTNALRYRLVDEGAAAVAAVSTSTRSLLLWGGVRADSVPYLEPAFVIDAPAALPDSAGDFRISGRTASGAELFSFSFTMPTMADGDGSSSFTFTVPVRAGWEGSLAAITLSGPGGNVTLDEESDIPVAILRDPQTGQVRAILRELPAAAETAADAVDAHAQGLEVLFSRGLPGTAAWRR